MRITRTLSALCCIGLQLLCTAALADEVRFDGQNVMLGELKHLDRGELYFKTPGTDTISIGWNHVDLVNSSKYLQIELDNGDILYGVLEPTDSQGQVLIRHDDGSDLVAISKVVGLTEIEDKFRERFDGSVTAGVSLTKANNYVNYNLGLDMTYTTKKYVSSLDLSSSLNQSDNAPKAEQSSLQIRSSRILKNRRYTGGLLNFERNEALGIDLRSSVGISVGKSLKHTNSHIFHLDGGLLVTKEDISGSSDTENSREAFIGATYEWFRYDDPELDLTTQFVVIPSLTQSGRVRGNFSLTLQWEIIDDLYWRISYQQNNDSDPPGDGATSDYNVFSGLTYNL